MNLRTNISPGFRFIPRRIFCRRILSPWQSCNIWSPLRIQRSVSNAPLPPKPWVEHFPTRLRPYLYLTRIDKPIGTLLLFYPCGLWSFFCDGQLLSVVCSLVHYHGFLRAGSTLHNPADLPRPIWAGSVSYAWCWLHDKRHLGQKS